jgi:hypothetical protein
MTRYIAVTLLLLTFPFPISAYTSGVSGSRRPGGGGGQSSTATLSGTVVDEHGAAISGAAVLIENVATRIDRQTTSNDVGFYVFPSLPPGTYNMTVRRNGFAPVEIKDVILNVNDQRALEVRLKVGNVSDTVTITADSGIQEQPAVGTVIDRQFVENLPLNGRSFHALIELTPGTVLTKATFNEQGQFSINGQRADANYFMVDGVSANIGVSAGFVPGQGAGSLPGLSALGGTNNLVSVDALQEFRVQTSTYAPEFGRTPGGQISIITRSGTNQFHGSLSEYFRNDALDANDWFANNLGLTRPALRQNDFGGVIGGPIRKDRAFFFFSYEGLRLRQPETSTTGVPSMNARQIAPPEIKPYLNAFPIPNGPDLGNNLAGFSTSFSNPSTLNATSIRLDYTLGDKASLFGRYNIAPSNAAQRGGVNGLSLNTITNTEVDTQTLTVGSVQNISPHLTNDIRFNWSRNVGRTSSAIDNLGGATVPGDSLLFSPGESRDNTTAILILSGGANPYFTEGRQARNTQDQINLVDGLSFVKGSHLMKFGVDYRRLSSTYDPSNLKEDLFNGVAGALNRDLFIYLYEASAGPRSPVFQNLSLYAQDTWRVRPRISLSYGLRWEFNPPPSERNGKDPAVLTGLGDPSTLTLAPLGTDLWRATHNNFAPRIAVSYELANRSGWETVLRGGFGLFYDLGNDQASTIFGSTFPYTAFKVVFNSPFPLDPVIAAAPHLSSTPGPFDQLVVADPGLKLPRTYEWNFGVQQSLGTNQVVSASYIGAAGRDLLRLEALNGLNPNFPTVDVIRNTATSDYHALQLQFQRRMASGVQAVVSYTWAHSIDIVSADSTLTLPIQKIDPSVDRGPSDFDVRHSLTAAVTYRVFTPGRDRVVNAILGNWSVDAILRARSATPVNVITGQFNLFGRSPRPDLVPDMPLYLEDPSVAGGRRIDPGAFSLPPPGRQGNLGRNALRGFAFWQTDLALRREFKLGERLNLQFRVESFNLFNHPNFADPIAALNNTSQFGRSIQMLSGSLGSSGVSGGFNPLYQVGGPRSLQLALKLQF